MKTIILICVLVVGVCTATHNSADLLRFEMYNKYGCTGFRYIYKDTSKWVHVCCDEKFPEDTTFKGFTTDKKRVDNSYAFMSSGLWRNFHNCKHSETWIDL